MLSFLKKNKTLKNGSKYNKTNKTLKNGSKYNKINEIRNMIKNPESEYLFPKKKINVTYTKRNKPNNSGKEYNLSQIATWDLNIDNFVKDILLPLSKKGISFSSFNNFKEWILSDNSLEQIDTTIVNKLYTYLKHVQTNHYSNENIKNLRALLNYEKIPYLRNEPVQSNKEEYLNDITVRERIDNLIKHQIPLEKELIVWRGQTTDNIILPYTWFSSSLKKDIAIKYTDRNNNLFKIHIQPGIKVIDLYAQYKQYGIKNPVNNVYKMRALMRNYTFIHPISKYTRNYSKYNEYLVESGGKFYKDINKLEEGFKEIYSNSDKTKRIYYETYYFPSLTNNTNRNNINNIDPLRSTRKSYRSLSAPKIIGTRQVNIIPDPVTVYKNKYLK